MKIWLLLITLTSGTNTGTVDVVFYTTSATQVEVTSVSSSIEADGTSTVQIDAQLTDNYGNDIAEIGTPITFTTSSGTIVTTPVNTDSAGKASTTLRSTSDFVGDVTVTAAVGTAFSDTAVVEFTSPAYDNEISLPQDQWQLLSVPKILDPSDKNSVFTGDYVTAYDADAESYIVPSNINPGHGYWVLNPNAAYDLDLSTLYKYMGNGTAPYSVDLETGWNLIGHGSVNTMLVEDSLYSINDKYSFVLDWTGTAWNLYSVSSPKEFHVMEPGKGYWVFMDEAATYTTPGI